MDGMSADKLVATQVIGHQKTLSQTLLREYVETSG
jgi:hypothetical protein